MLRARQQRRRDAKKIFLGLLAEGRLNEIKISSLIFTEKFHRSKKLNQRSFFCVKICVRKKGSRAKTQGRKAWSTAFRLGPIPSRHCVKKQGFIFYPLPYPAGWRFFSRSVPPLACLACYLLRWQSCNESLHKNG